MKDDSRTQLNRQMLHCLTSQQNPCKISSYSGNHAKDRLGRVNRYQPPSMSIEGKAHTSLHMMLRAEYIVAGLSPNWRLHLSSVSTEATHPLPII